ncbi:hypothetical protein [Actinoplanes derwentensis]|uniref:Uncharacterized protein n=1 Tax=Actinoplanes derwentensis TaxID=113562 RepID=A0A1H1S5A1_9ACTN|nr:hypothetical protein [Actinoplanes derwentensis]SDS42419.1 hypothetical protein SAMN04489716_0753 [Actinoplanes derwentensis]
MWSGGPGSEPKLQLTIQANGAYEFSGQQFGTPFSENGRITVEEKVLTFEPTLSDHGLEPRTAVWKRSADTDITNILVYSDLRYGYFSFVQIG